MADSRLVDKRGIKGGITRVFVFLEKNEKFKGQQKSMHGKLAELADIRVADDRKKIGVYQEIFDICKKSTTESFCVFFLG